jgi:hypothetical protein
MLVCFIYFAREAAGASGTRLSLRPLFFEGHGIAQLGQIAPRDREAVSSSRHCEEQSDEAIHSSLTRRDGLLRFARNDGLGA